jgi:hypothetical protein
MRIRASGSTARSRSIPVSMVCRPTSKAARISVRTERTVLP